MNRLWVGSKMPGKPWQGTTAPKMVIHTLEFYGWPLPEKWDSPSHFVYNPSTRELRQYLPVDRAAYAVRDNTQEDDELTLQVELWGQAHTIPYRDDDWYDGLAEFVVWVNETYNIPIEFADFSNVRYGTTAPQRMSDDAVTAFSGFLGHCHMGWGNDSHWDPGNLDVPRLLKFVNERVGMPRKLFIKMIKTFFLEPTTEFKPKTPNPGPNEGYNYWINLIDDPDNPEWDYFFAALARTIAR